jgi:hypothetical protein
MKFDDAERAAAKLLGREGDYSTPVDEECGDAMPVDDWLECVAYGFFIDYDGTGHPALDGMMDERIVLRPSDGAAKLPFDCTHVVWYNR